MKKFALVALSPILLVGCGNKLSDFQAVGEWSYITNSSHKVRVEGVSDFDLSIGGSHSFTLVEMVGKENFDENDYMVPYKIGDTKIIFNGNKEFITSVDRSILSKKSYQANKIGNGHYEFTYTFTDAYFPA